MTIALDKDTVQETFRNGLLAALDMLARDVFANVPKAQRNDTGASDADLPELFKSIDAQVERLCARYDVVLIELEDAK